MEAYWLHKGYYYYYVIQKLVEEKEWLIIFLYIFVKTNYQKYDKGLKDMLGKDVLEKMGIKPEHVNGLIVNG